MYKKTEMKSFNRENKKEISKMLFTLISDHFSKEKDEKKELKNNIVDRVFSEMLWSATEDDNSGKSKKHKIPLWSSQAITKYIANREKPKVNNSKGLIHEHIYPKSLLKSDILDLKKKDKLSEESIEDLLNSYSHGAIITSAENKKFKEWKEEKLNSDIPKEYKKGKSKIEKLFSRYLFVRIELHIVRFENDIPKSIGKILSKNGKVEIDYVILDRLYFKEHVACLAELE